MATRKTHAVTEVRQADYMGATESYYGFCVTCRAFTTSGCEPDAREYECEECGEKTAYGAEEAIMMGLITFSDDDEGDDFDGD